MGKRVMLTPAQKKEAYLKQKRLQLAEDEAKAKALAMKKAAEERERVMTRAGPDRKIKMAIASLTKALWKYELTNLQRNDIKEKINSYTKELKDIDRPSPEKYKTTIHEHMKFISESPELVQIFRILWICMLPHIKSHDIGIEKGIYIRLHVSLQYILNGNPDDKIAIMAANENWEADIRLYNGSIGQLEFWDMFYEITTQWLDVFDHLSYTTFLWSLIDTLFDTSIYLPKLRPKRQQRHITADSEGTYLQSWFFSRGHIENLINQAIVSVTTTSVLKEGTGTGTVPALYETITNENAVKDLKYKDNDDVEWKIHCYSNENINRAIRQASRKTGLVANANDVANVSALVMITQKEKMKNGSNNDNDNDNNTDTDSDGGNDDDDAPARDLTFTDDITALTATATAEEIEIQRKKKKKDEHELNL
jgi:hypothetical protein